MKEDKYIRFIHLYCSLFSRGGICRPIAKTLYWLNRLIFSCDIPCSVKIGKNLHLPHLGLGVVIHPRTIIGNNVKIYHQVTIGVRNPGYSSKISIGDDVTLGAGCKILGRDEMKIGNNVKVGANSVVLSSVPDNVTIAGIPAKIIEK